MKCLAVNRDCLARQLKKICAKLGLSEEETQHFCDLVEIKHARSPAKKKLAEERVQLRQSKYTELEHDSFQVIADWYHLAIIELMDCDSFQSEPEWLAWKLGISEAEVEVALERLQRLGMIELVDGRYQTVQGQNYVAGGVPSESIKKFHRQLIEKSIEALFMQPVDSREFFTTLIGINQQKMGEAKALIKDFSQKFCQLMDTGGGKQDLYCFAVQFYQLGKEEAK